MIALVLGFLSVTIGDHEGNYDAIENLEHFVPDSDDCSWTFKDMAVLLVTGLVSQGWRRVTYKQAIF